VVYVLKVWLWSLSLVFLNLWSHMKNMRCGLCQTLLNYVLLLNFHLENWIHVHALMCVHVSFDSIRSWFSSAWHVMWMHSFFHALNFININWSLWYPLLFPVITLIHYVKYIPIFNFVFEIIVLMLWKFVYDIHLTLRNCIYMVNFHPPPIFKCMTNYKCDKSTSLV